MKTAIKARNSKHWTRHYQRAYWRWKLLGESSEFSENYLRFTANNQAGPLTPERVAEVTRYQAEEDTHYADRSKEAITSDNLESSRFRFAYLLRDLLERRPDIRRIANIGARVDLWSAYLAPRFPDREFVSVDFQPNLTLHNSLLPQSPNWSFLTGYWRDVPLKSDLYFSISTSVLMNNVELNAYLDLPAKAFAFCEGWWPRADKLIDLVRPRVIPPEEIPKEEPYCSGSYANYHHNYVAKLEERGFTVSLSQIVPYTDNFHYLQLIAER